MGVIVREPPGGSHSQETTGRPAAGDILAAAPRNVPHPPRARGRGTARLRDHERCGSAIRGHRAAGAGDALWRAEATAGGGAGGGKQRARGPGKGRRAAPLLPTDTARPIRGACRGATAPRDGACRPAQEADRDPTCMSPATAERIYRRLLRAYPPDFRAEYGRESVLLFRDQCQESDVRTVGFWAAVICDVARSAPALRAAAWRARVSETTRTIGGIMKLAAMLTVLVGVFGILNAMVEWGAALTGTIGGMHTLALVLSVCASALILAAGAAILRPTGRSRRVARLALLASLVMIVAARLLHPWMSVFSQPLGIGFPAVFLIALYWPRRASPSGAV